MGLLNRRTCDERKIEKILETDVETGRRTDREESSRQEARQRETVFHFTCSQPQARLRV